MSTPRRRARPISKMIATPFTPSDARHKLSEAKISAGTFGHQKWVLRLTAERLTKIEGHRVSMAEVVRRALRSAGIQ